MMDRVHRFHAMTAEVLSTMSAHAVIHEEVMIGCTDCTDWMMMMMHEVMHEEVTISD